VLVMAGGILPDEDIPAIEALGIQGNFGPGTPVSTIIAYVRQHIHPQRLEQPLAPLHAASTPLDTSSSTEAPAHPQPQAAQ
jgi:hypothetical protein